MQRSEMTEEERLGVYINSLDRENPGWLEELEACTIREGVPLIRRQTQSLLRVLLAIRQPARILEIGTGTGFSALFMSEYAPKGAHITTIEKYEKRIPRAKENFHKSGRTGCITLLEGDAADILPQLSGSFDFVFMDGAKGQYIHFLPDVLRLLEEGGILVSDNVLQEGDIVQSRFAVTRRNRTIHARMREYLYELKHNAALETVILSLGDGTAVSVKRRPQEQG